MFRLLLGLGVLGGLALAVKRSSAASSSIAGVRSARGPSGVDYEVFRRGGGTYEVVKRGDAQTFIIFGQDGELEAKGSAEDLELMRSDMRKFPSDLFG